MSIFIFFYLFFSFVLRLYWADPKTGSIESVNLEGKDRVVVRRFRLSTEDKPYKIDVFEDSLFLVMHQTHGISRLNKFGQGNTASFFFIFLFLKSKLIIL